MRRNVAFVLLVVFLMGAGAVPSVPPSLEPLRDWVGYYPFDEFQGQTFWQRLASFAETRKFSGQETLASLFDPEALGVSTPVQERQGILYTSGCKAHACSARSASFFVDIGKQVLYVCWRTEGNDKDIWLSSEGEYKLMARGTCSEQASFDLLDTMLGREK